MCFQETCAMKCVFKKLSQKERAPQTSFKLKFRCEIFASLDILLQVKAKMHAKLA